MIDEKHTDLVHLKDLADHFMEIHLHYVQRWEEQFSPHTYQSTPIRL